MIPLEWRDNESYPGKRYLYRYLSLSMENLFKFIDFNEIDRLLWIIRENRYMIIANQTLAIYYPNDDSLVFNIENLEKLFDDPIHLVKLRVMKKEIIQTIRCAPWCLTRSVYA